MANKQQLKDLKELDITYWNKWRKQHPEIQIDLFGADLREATLTEADLSGANLSETTLREANLIRTNLIGADLSGAYLSGAYLTGADLTGANLTKANLSRATLSRAKLTGATLSGATLERADLEGAYLSGIYLERINLRETTLSRASLSRATLTGADLTGANFTKADLSKATLSKAKLTGANLREADLREADLSGAILEEADLSGAILTETTLTNTICGNTTFGTNNLSTTKGLDTIQHRRPSTLDINTIYRSQGNIPEIFLRGCGVPDDMIAYIRSIAGAIQYYTVFISYSSKNRDFTQRLYDNLQGKGIRCWFDQGSLKGGDPFWEIIDQAIIQYDKVIIALSEESIQSPNVAREVEQALAKEQQLREQGTPKTVLFPLTLDYAIKTTTIPWAADIQHTRHIIDFTAWKNEDNYQAAFTRLLSDLKADT